MTMYRLLVSLHGLMGLVALVTFWTTAAMRKGTARHRRVGQVFLLSMTGILATALPMAWVIQRSGRPVVAAFLAYLAVIVAAGVATQSVFAMVGGGVSVALLAGVLVWLAAAPAEPASR